MSIEKERKAFEEWVSKETKWDLYWSENINQYMDHQTNAAWLAWPASANREGYKLVDKKKLAKVLNCVTDDWLIDTGAMDEFKEIESLVSDEIKAMIGACDAK